MKHTAGPWKVGKHGTSVKKSDGFNIRLERARGGGGNYAEKEDERLKADAHLIAASPEMFDALDNLLRAYGGGSKDCGHDYNCTCPWDKAEAAIAKTEGEA